MPGPVSIPTNANPTINQGFDTYSPRRGRPILFQVLAPGTMIQLYNVLLALHINPQSLSEKMKKNKSIVMSQGGYVEYVWPDELDTISAEQTTGAFIGPNTGLVAGDSNSNGGINGRQNTIAWERSEDLQELFHQNGVVYNSTGFPVLRGQIMCVYDRGIYLGHFTQFSVGEEETGPYHFNLTWEFTVEDTIYEYPQGPAPTTAQQTALNPTTGNTSTGLTGTAPVQNNNTPVNQTAPFLPNGDINTQNQSTLTFQQIDAGLTSGNNNG